MNESHDEQLERAQREIRAQAATLHQRPRQARVAPTAARGDERIEPRRLAYRIGELTDAHYRAFVDQSFHALLKRLPSEAEAAVQVAALAAGATKAEILGNLRWSPEGRRIGVHVAGLLPRYASAKLRRVPLLGYLLDFALTLAALPQLARHQRASDALLAAGDEAAAARNAALAARFAVAEAHAGSQFDLLQQRVDDLHGYAHGLRTALDELTRTLVDVDAATRARIGELADAGRQQSSRLDDLELVRRQLHRVIRWSDALDDAFAQVDAFALERERNDLVAAAAVAESVVAADAHRGVRNAVWAARLGEWLAPGARVLTLACDTDWPRALLAQGLEAIDPAPADDAQDASPRHGLARHADASLDGLAALAPAALLVDWTLPAFAAEARRVVRPGGALLFACAPEGVAVMHALRARPLPSLDIDLVAHVLATAGFVDVRRIDAADGSPALLAREAAR
ncbi:MAG: hypothetical protein EOP90_05300 [Lysobacteraceae bacterium]|nr:MAG: hypothetical protein EOP90_05300 [Xanthomonadaceae bacterium]